MDDDARVDAVSYLDRFFDAIRDEARANPALAARLVEALGGEVVFEAKDQVALFNPLKLAAKGGSALETAADGLTAAQLKAVMKAHNLATPVDVRGRSKEELGALLVERARARLSERSDQTPMD